MIRTNGNRARIGNVYRVPTEATGCAFSAFQIGLQFDSPTDAAFAYWMLAESGMQDRISASASGTTGLGNVAIRWLRQQALPWPELESERAELVGLFDSCSVATRRTTELEAALHELRTAVLADLLSGNHRIPDSYDEQLERAS